MHTAPNGSLLPKAEPLQAYLIPEVHGDMTIEDWLLKDGFKPAIGSELLRLGQVLDGETICGVLMYFANAAELCFVNIGDELWAGATLPPSSMLDGMTVRR
jgi:hypothetical protein